MTDYKKLPCHGKFCGRPGLPFLPLRVGYVPQGLQNIPGGILNSSYANGVYAHFSDGKPMLRVITEGYVFMYDPRIGMGWRGFAATPDGRFMEVPIVDDERPKKQPTFGCRAVSSSTCNRINGSNQHWPQSVA